MITFKHEELVLDLMERLLRENGATYGLRPACAVGIVQGGELVGGIAYHNYDPAAGVVEMSMASLVPLRATRQIVLALTELPFTQFNVQAIVCRVGADNDRALQQLARLGFTLHRIPRLRGRDKDEVICVLTDDAWAANRLSTREFRERYKSRVKQDGQERWQPASAA